MKYINRALEVGKAVLDAGYKAFKRDPVKVLASFLATAPIACTSLPKQPAKPDTYIERQAEPEQLPDKVSEQLPDKVLLDTPEKKVIVYDRFADRSGKYDTKEIIFYQEGREIIRIYESDKNNDGIIDSRKTREFDQEGRKIREIVERDDNNDGITDSRETRVYNQDGEWIKTTETFDSFGNLIQDDTDRPHRN